ncbi:MAG: GPO family capsid scaffolding protein [Desulfovibrio sp.]
MGHTLITDFVKVAQSGATIDGRNIDPQWLRDMAETYDPETYHALIWPEHSRWGGNYGSVEELKVVEENGIVSLYAKLSPNERLLDANKEKQKLFTSIEHISNFSGSGKAYLGGLAVTDSPASLGTEKLQFSLRDPKDRKVISGVELDQFTFSNDTDTAEAFGKEARNLFKKFFSRTPAKTETPEAGANEDVMTDEQAKEFNAGQQALAAAITALGEKMDGHFSAQGASEPTPAKVNATPKAETPADDKYSAQLGVMIDKFDTMKADIDDMKTRFSQATPATSTPATTGSGPVGII